MNSPLAKLATPDGSVVIAASTLSSAGDFCMLRSELWEGLGLTWDDNMCVACIEAKLGRPLSMLSNDFICFPYVEGYPMSNTLRDRIIGDNVVLKSGELVARDSRRGKAELRKRNAKIKTAKET
jgi:hypothetical protein